MAADDRARSARYREFSETDELTGVSRRGAGLLAIQGEIDRARRTSGGLLVAYVDVDGLKAENDREGHAAGDSLLMAVADALRGCVRSYDVITRVGGDEFVCSLSGISIEVARRKFASASTGLAAAWAGASMTVGFAQLESDDSADDLIQRADDDVLRTRKSRQNHPGHSLTRSPGRARNQSLAASWTSSRPGAGLRRRPSAPCWCPACSCG